MDQLDRLESQGIYILREAYKSFKNLCMLWSIGKDSTVMLWLARKAFFGHVPFPLVHIDTRFKIPEMIAYRDQLARDWGLTMVVGLNEKALADGMNHTRGRLTCCTALKTQALKQTLDGSGPRYRLGPDGYAPETNREPYTGVIVGARGDEEGSRSKERYFSPRGVDNDWDLDDQPPELWDQFNTDFGADHHVRVHPILHWTEVDIWRYVQREKIPMCSLYFAQDGKRYRSLGCMPITKPIDSNAETIEQIIAELEDTRTPERAGRGQDTSRAYAMQKLRAMGYM